MARAILSTSFVGIVGFFAFTRARTFDRPTRVAWVMSSVLVVILSALVFTTL